jgi:hypothetical protein
MCVGAGQAAACRRSSRINASFRIVASSSSAFAASISRFGDGRPSGENISRISSSENPAVRQTPINASCSSTATENTRARPWRRTQVIRPRSS